MFNVQTPKCSLWIFIVASIFVRILEQAAHTFFCCSTLIRFSSNRKNMMNFQYCLYSRSKKKNYLFQYKLSCRNKTGNNHHNALKFFFGVRLYGGSRPNFNFFNVNANFFQQNRKVHLSNSLKKIFSRHF